jgi:hypothetical protein
MFGTRYAVEHPVYILQVTVALKQRTKQLLLTASALLRMHCSLLLCWCCILSLWLLLIADICVHHRWRLHSGNKRVGGCYIMFFINCKYLLVITVHTHIHAHVCKHVHTCTHTCTHIPWSHKCVIKTAGRGESYKYTNFQCKILQTYKNCITNCLHTPKFIYTVQAVCMWVFP